MRFRFAKPRDFEAFSALARQAQDLHVAWRPDLFRPVEYPFEASFYQRRTEAREILLACEGKQIIAYAAFDITKKENPMQVPRTVLHLDNLCVDAAWRGKGVASALIDHLCAYAKKQGCNDFQLTCYPENAAGMALYESLGMHVKTVQFEKKL